MEGAILHGGVGEKKNSKQQRGTTKIEQYTARKTNNDYFFREHVSFGGKLLGYFIWILSPETIWTKKLFLLGRTMGHQSNLWSSAHRSFTRIHHLGWVISWVKL